MLSSSYAEHLFVGSHSPSLFGGLSVCRPLLTARWCLDTDGWTRTSVWVTLYARAPDQPADLHRYLTSIRELADRFFTDRVNHTIGYNKFFSDKDTSLFIRPFRISPTWIFASMPLNAGTLPPYRCQQTD